METQPLIAVEGGPIWIDLGTHDLDGAIEFYTALLGWEFGEGSEQFGGYRMIHKDGLPIGGAMTTLMGPEGPTTEPQGPTAWSVYLRTANIEQTLAKAVEHGAQVLVPAMSIADLGSMAILIDPAGAAIGAWQPETFDGIANCARVGTPCWFENMTMNFDAASAFYRDVFAWDLQVNPTQQEAAPKVRYVTHGTGEKTAAGMCEANSVLPEGTPSYWRVYFGVADLDHSLAELKRLGGSVIDPGGDTPFGRIATVADPQGAQFQLLKIKD
ncbi:MAG: VOC family protein [Propionibacteriaceae bacterium]|nr:VOC family protein [Propionibacteriaceae bacterium]